MIMSRRTLITQASASILIGTNIDANGNAELPVKSISKAKLIITGHRGNIGSRLVSYYEQKGYDVIGIDKKDGIEYDLSSLGVWSSFLITSVPIIHLAGVGTDKATQDEVNKDNIAATQNLLYAASISNTPRIIFTSSCWVRPTFYRDDNTSELPDRPYGWAKVEQERMITQWALDNLKHRAFIIRVGWAPPEGTPKPTNWTERLYNSTSHLTDYFDHALTHKTAQYYCVDMAKPRET